MDTRTGQIYGSLEAALAAGVPADKVVTGPEPALQDLSRLIRHDRRRRRQQQRKRHAAAAKKAQRNQQHASRKRNRR